MIVHDRFEFLRKEVIEPLGLRPDLSKTKRIRLFGKDYLLIKGAIATQEAYENFEMSFAHLFPDGNIKRLNQIIGTEKDIEYLDEKETKNG